MKELILSRKIADKDSDLIDNYLRDITRHELLSNVEEAELAVRIRGGDLEALNRLVNANLRFVVSVAKQYQGNGLSLGDLICEGNLGLIRAAQKFDETRGFKFISYAVWWVRQSMMQAIVEQSKLIRLPMNKVNEFRKISSAFKQFEQKYQREPDLDELAEMLGMKREQIESYHDHSISVVSTDAPMHNGEHRVSETIADTESASQDDEMFMEFAGNELVKMIGHLNEREGEVLKCYFGLHGNDPMTLEEIGERFQITRERVRQIKEQALKRLKTNKSSQALYASYY